MTFGTEWGWGCDEKISREIFETFVEAGGNFIDTANRYTEGTSERMPGEFIRSDRDKYVIATKYTLFGRLGDVSRVELGFPHEFLNNQRIRDVIFGVTYDKMKFQLASMNSEAFMIVA